METLKFIIESGAKSVITLGEIIKAEVTEWQNSQERKLMLEGQKYYRGDADILLQEHTAIGEHGRQETVKNLEDNKLVHNFLRKLTDQKNDYLLNKPMSIQTDNAKYLQQLNDIFDKSMLRKIKNLGKEAINKGLAWLHVFYDDEGVLSFKKIPTEECIPLWKDNDHTELDAFIRVYEIEAYEDGLKKIVTKVEFWDTSGVKKYVLAEDLVPDVEAGEQRSHFSVVEESETNPANWERIPFICFKYNDDELPLIKFVKSLIDDYNKHKSDDSNNLENLPNSKQTRKDIFEFGRGVAFDHDQIGDSPSEVYLKLLYADLDMDCNSIETEFKSSLEQLLWFINVHLYNTTRQDYTAEKVDFIFNRAIITNESKGITDIKDSVGII